jgi:hypothetical protein
MKKILLTTFTASFIGTFTDDDIKYIKGEKTDKVRNNKLNNIVNWWMHDASIDIIDIIDPNISIISIISVV